MQLDDRREQLVALGLDLFSRRSFEDVSVDAIAEAAGISRGLLYHYFGSKRGFYRETVRAAAASLLAAATPEGELRPDEGLRAGLRGYLSFVEAHAAVFLSLVRGGATLDAEVSEIVQRTRLAFGGLILEMAGIEAPRPVFRSAVSGWVGTVEAASADWLEHRSPDKEQVAELLAAQLGVALFLASQLDPEAHFTVDLDPRSIPGWLRSV